MRKLSLAVLGLVAAGFVHAATFEGTQVSKTLTRAGKNLKGDAHVQFSLTSEIFRVTTRREVVAETVWECENDTPANGRDGDWKGFFQATKEDKPYRLAEAIKGVGVATARRLVNEGYFNNKPRSWSEFKKRMQDADNDFQTGFSYDVVVKFGKDNMVNLGYLVEGQCGFKTQMVERLVPVRTKVRDEVRQYELRLQNGALLAGEKEEIIVSFDGVEDGINASSPYNEYKIDRWTQNGLVVFDLVGTRKAVRPSNTLNLAANVTNGKLEVTVTDAAFDTDLAALEDHFVVAKVQIDRRAWHKNIDLASFEKPLSKSGALTELKDLNIQVPAGKDLILYYELRTSGSRFHSADLSPQNKLKLKLN